MHRGGQSRAAGSDYHSENDDYFETPRAYESLGFVGPPLRGLCGEGGGGGAYGCLTGREYVLLLRKIRRRRLFGLIVFVSSLLALLNVYMSDLRDTATNPESHESIFYHHFGGGAVDLGPDGRGMGGIVGGVGGDNSTGTTRAAAFDPHSAPYWNLSCPLEVTSWSVALPRGSRPRGWKQR